MYGGTGVPAMLGGLSTLSPSKLWTTETSLPAFAELLPSQVLYIVSINLTYCRSDQ